MNDVPEYTPPPREGIVVVCVEDKRWAVMKSWVSLRGSYQYEHIATFDTEEEANGVLKLLGAKHENL